MSKLGEDSIKYFRHFYAVLGYRIFLSLFLSVLVGLLDGIGITMFIPMLKLLQGGGETESSGFEFVDDAFSYLNLDLTLNSAFILIGIVFTLKGIVTYLSSLYNVFLLQKFVVTIRSESLNYFAAYSYKSYINSDAGVIQNTFTSEVSKVVKAYKGFVMTLQNFIFLLVYLSLAFVSSVSFALLVVVGGALSSLLFYRINKFTGRMSKKVTTDGHLYQGLLIQSVNYFKYLKATGSFELFRNRLIDVVKKIEKNNIRMGLVQAFLTTVREPLIVIITLFVIYVQISYFGVNMGAIIISLLFFYRAMNALITLQTQWNSFQSVSGSMHNLEEFVKELKQNPDVNGNMYFEKLNKGLKLHDLDFAYNERENILKKVTIEIKKNETVAFVGESGSGKTTLVNILSGLLPVDRGSYFLDEVDSCDLDKKTLQRRIGYITQEPVIFDDDVFNNVTFWSEKNKENIERFWNVLEKAAIKEFVMCLPDRENSPLGNNGVKISGGQKQRISIARELYKDIDILVMDEATSALDSETEKFIQQNIDQLKGEYTIIIIAHRLSTIKNADKIYLMKNGEVACQGSFSEMYDENEYFRNLVNLQKL